MMLNSGAPVNKRIFLEDRSHDSDDDSPDEVQGKISDDEFDSDSDDSNEKKKRTEEYALQI